MNPLFFTQRESASRKVGFSGIQKCTAAIRQLAYGTGSDAWDEYLRMSSRMCRDSLENLCEGVIFLYGRQYLRMPTAADVPLLYEAHQRIHGFPGMLHDVAPDTSFYANDVEYKYGYYLTDGIYLEWATLVKTLLCPDDEKRMHLKKNKSQQEKISSGLSVC
ncbi:uncharacterized protein LOC110869764 [Helianthus annuus]|uniref:uncharacterized protein LOC110869764 n=1 Tax=Helianthus annuus TaxID=4232 RepID=UPI000B8FE7BC|nr:uncharacterized protein LOC110869764 [Helianthus annuus]